MDPAKCLANAKLFDPNAVLCTSAFCSGGGSAYLDARCHCRPPFTQNPCPYSADSPVWMDNGTPNGCYCCCSCFAYGTPVNDSATTAKEIQTYVVGDKVWAGSVIDGQLQWEELAVEFSSGVRPNEENGKTVVTVYYSIDGEQRSIVVTPDHVMILSDLTVKLAVDLDPATDQLITPDGAAVPILGWEMGGWWKGLHHIATSEEPATSLNQHLLASNGIVTGDWALQISQIPADATGAFEAAVPKERLRTSAWARRAKIDDSARPEGFQAYNLEEAFAAIPIGAQLYFTSDQSSDIYYNTKQYPPAMSTPLEITYWAFRTLQGYYANVNFYLQWEMDLPNVFTFQQYGLNMVVITGGLVRIQGMTLSGILGVLANATARFVGGPPLVPTLPISCLGQADYFSMLAVLRNVIYVGDFPRMSREALAQINMLFDAIDPGHRGGIPDDTCNGISIDCRIDALSAGLSWLPLPRCAGGPGIDYLEVESAETTPISTGGQVTLAFNMDLDVTTALNVANYSFDPPIAIEGVAMPLGQATVVDVSAAMLPGQSYQLTLVNLLSRSGNFLENGQAVVTVQLP